MDPAPAPMATPAEGGPYIDRIWTVPNALTLLRLLYLPVFWWLVVVQDERIIGAATLALVATTDWFDGQIARRYGQESNFGKLFDPISDRLLFLVAVTGIVVVDGAPFWLSMIVLAREVLMTVVTLVITALGARPVEVVFVGKAGTFLNMTAFPLFLAGSGADAPELFTLAGWAAAIPGVVLSWYATALYAPQWVRNTKEGRARRVAARTGEVS